MFTFRPDDRTWSTPPKPMSYAQPSPPMIQTPLRTRSPASASRWRASDRDGPVDRGQAPRGDGPPARAGGRSPLPCPGGPPRMPVASSSPTSGARRVEQLPCVVRLGVERQPHPQPELRVVLEQGVVPGGPAAGRVHGPGRGRQVGAVDRRAARRVGHDHAVAEELAHEPDVGRLAAAAAGARELEQRLEHLRALDGVVRQQAPVEERDRLEEVPALPLHIAVERHGLHVDGLVAGVGLALGGTDVDAHATAGAIVGSDLDGQPMIEQVAGLELLVQEVRGRSVDRRRREHLHPDGRVGTDHGALATVDADGRVPDGQHLGDGPLLVLRGAARERPVDGQRAHRQPVAVAGDQPRRDACHEVGHVTGHRRGRRAGGREAAQRDMAEPLQRAVDRGEVAGDDRLAALGVRLLDEPLDARDGLVRRQDAREVEEAGLHDGVDPVAHARLSGDGERVDHPEVDALVDQLPLHAARQMLPDLVRPVRAS